MSHRLWFFVCAILGLSMAVCGLLVPVHLRAVDDVILEAAGKGSHALIDEGAALADANNLGAAQMISQAARLEKLRGVDQLESKIATVARENPNLKAFGVTESGAVGELFRANAASGEPQFVTEFFIRTENREKALALLERSNDRAVQELLKFRAATNTVLFPAVQSSSGQALEAALAMGGVLLENRHLSTELSNALLAAALEANRGGNTQPLEQCLMDLMSLGQRFNWGQLTVMLESIDGFETLRLQANLVRQAGTRLPILFSAVHLSGNPSAVAKYLTSLSQTGWNDLGVSLRYGAGGLNELLGQQHRLHIAKFQPLLVGWCLQIPAMALTVKWFLYLLGGFLLALALHFARPAVSVLERPLQVRGFHIAREFLFALGFLLVVLLLSEPFLAQESQRADTPIRLHLPMAGGAASAGKASAKSPIMNPTNKLIMLLFFTVQGLLYTASVVKLAEIRRQRVRAS
ncbi:MAG: hypothetical protein ACTHKU_15795, partial [Verrucomicrobiota bacterium]